MFKTFIFLYLSFLGVPLFAQWNTITLSESKFYTQAIASNGKAFFVGGAKPGFIPTNQIDIYDFATKQASQRSMQFSRVLFGLVASDSLLFIAGGLNPQTNFYYKQVEIYDVKNDVWKPVQNLSVARASVSAVKIGQELWFGGGYIQTSATAFTFYDVIDVYNLQSNQWSTRKLSAPRVCSAAVLGNRVVFAGGQGIQGATDLTDIFNSATQQWTTAQLSVPRFNAAIATAEPYVIVAGGSTFVKDALDVVDLWNTQTNTWTTSKLSAPRALIGASNACGDKAIFAGGGDADWDTRFLSSSSNAVDIFDAATGQWSQSALSQARVAAFAGGDGARFFVGGGWYPEMNAFVNTAEIYSCGTSGAGNGEHDALLFSLSPNPSTGEFWIRVEAETFQSIAVFDMWGRRVAYINPIGATTFVSLPNLPKGVYHVRVMNQKGKTGWSRWVKG